MKNKKKMGRMLASDGSAGADRAGGSHTGAGEPPEADPQ